MKALKIAALILAALLLLLVAVVAVLAARFDTTGLKQGAIKQLREQKQRNLRLDGDLSLTFFPRLGLRVDEVSLSEAGSEQESLRVASAHVAVRLLPLLSRQVVIERIELRGLQAILVRRQDGGFNIDDLLAGAPQGGDSVRFDIDTIRLTDAVLSYRDAVSGQRIQLREVAVQTDRLGAPMAKGGLHVSGKLETAALATAVRVELSADYAIDFAQRRFALSGVKARLGPELAGSKELEINLAANALAVAVGKGEVDVGVEVDGLDLEIKSEIAGDALEARLLAPKLAMVGDRASGAAVRGTVNLAGKTRQFDGRFELSAPEGSAQALRMSNFALQWAYRQGPMALRGQLAGAVEGSLKSPQFAFPKLSGLLEFEHPALPMQQIKLPITSHVQWTLAESTVFAELATRFDQTELQSRWQISRFSPLTVRIDLEMDRLNVDQYLPAVATDAPAEVSLGRLLDPSGPPGVDLRGTLRIGALQLRKLKIKDFQADLRLVDGRFELASAAATAKRPTLCQKRSCP